MKKIIINLAIVLLNFILTFLIMPRLNESDDIGKYFVSMMFFYFLYVIHGIVLLIILIKKIIKKENSRTNTLLFTSFILLFFLLIYAGTIVKREHFQLIENWF